MPVVVDPPQQEPSPPQISVGVSDGTGGGRNMLVDVHCTFDPRQVRFNRRKSPAAKFTSGPGFHHWSLVKVKPQKTKFLRGLRSAVAGAKVRFVVIDWATGQKVTKTKKLKNHP